MSDTFFRNLWRHAQQDVAKPSEVGKHSVMVKIHALIVVSLTIVLFAGHLPFTPYWHGLLLLSSALLGSMCMRERLEIKDWRKEREIEGHHG